MALENITRSLLLDVYDHDTTPSTIKAIACDDNTRYVTAQLFEQGIAYYIPEESNVTLTIVRPDKVGVSITGSTWPFEHSSSGGIPIDDEEETSTDPVVETVYGVQAELNQPALVVPGTLLAQFKIETGTQILRTEIFYINNGRALDADTSEWADEYQGYNLDEFANRIETVENNYAAFKEEIRTSLTDIVNHKLSVDGDTIRITT